MSSMDHSGNDVVADSAAAGQVFKVPTSLSLTKRLTTSAAAAFSESTAQPLPRSLERCEGGGARDDDDEVMMCSDDKTVNDNVSLDDSSKQVSLNDSDDVKRNVNDNNEVEHSSSSSKTSSAKSSKLSSSSKPSSSASSGGAGPQITGLDYVEPAWGGGSDGLYSFEIIKNGTVVDRYDLSTRSYHVFGRLPSCHHSMDHPSLSRYHAIIQHCSTASTNPAREAGWYLYDLDSTHGTWINKHRVQPNVYQRLRVGYVVKFGGSSRMYIVQGPCEDQDVESELSVREMREQRERQKRETEILRHIEQDEETDRRVGDTDSGCMWGMGEDAVEEEEEEGGNIGAANPFSLPENEALYIDDPKKALRGFFEREGLDLPEYHADDDGRPGTHRCKVEVPIDTSTGEPLVVEVTGITGKKKDAVVACALETCRTLDRMGLLRQSTHESRAARKRRHQGGLSDEDDDDEYLDRTGEVRRKRESRLLRVNKSQSSAETFESLSEKLSEALREREELETRLERDREARTGGGRQGVGEGEEEEDELDIFMNAIKSGTVMDVKTCIASKQRLAVVKQLILHLQRLVQLSKPSLPLLSTSLPSTAPPTSALGPASTSPTALSTSAHGPASTSPTAPELASTNSTALPTSAPGPVNRAPAVLPTVGRMKCAIKPNRPVAVVSQGSAIKSGGERGGENGGEFVEEEEEEEESDSSKTGSNKTTEEDNVRADASATVEEHKSHQRPLALNSASQSKQSTNTAAADHRGGRTQGGRTQGGRGRGGRRKEEGGRKVETSSDPSLFTTWLPPTNQSGDGKTNLNNKYGY